MDPIQLLSITLLALTIIGFARPVLGCLIGHQSSRPLAVLVGLLVMVALFRYGNDLIEPMLRPFQALGLTFNLLPFL